MVNRIMTRPGILGAQPKEELGGLWGEHDEGRYIFQIYVLFSVFTMYHV